MFHSQGFGFTNLLFLIEIHFIDQQSSLEFQNCLLKKKLELAVTCWNLNK